MAVFQPRFVDLVRNYTTTTGTGDFVPGAAVNGYSSFASALQPGDRFYYSAIGIDNPAEREVGRGTLKADGAIARDPVNGALTPFTAGLKSLSLIAAAEWFNNVQAGGSGGGAELPASRAALASSAQNQPAILTEAGREGLFVFDGSNLSAQVAADTYQGIHVAPSGDPTGASGAWVRQFDGAVQLSWFGFADGAASNAARVESIETLFGRAVWMMAPAGVTNVDRDIRFTRPHRLSGHGMGGYAGGSPNGATVLKFPAGSTGIRIRHGAGSANAGYFQLENMSIAQASGLGTTGIASYDPAQPTRIDVSSGAANFADRQIVWLDGAGPSITIQDRTAAISSGSNVVTVATTAPTFIGNPGVYVGQQIDIAGAGLPAGTTVTAWSTTTITLSNNAAATVSAASYTVRYPIVAEIQSGGGTAMLTIDDPGAQAQAVTNGVLRHAPAALYSTVKVSCRDVFFGFGMEGVGAFLRGTTNDGSLADGCTFHNCYFGGAKAGMVLEGSDAQVGCFTGCNFAGPEIGALDMGLLGNSFFGCHFAFNVGIVVTYSGAVTNVVSSYLETGTSYVGPSSGGQAAFFNTVNGQACSGWNGTYFTGGSMVTRQLAADAMETRKGLTLTDGGSGSGLYVGGRLTGLPPLSSGAGVHIASGGAGFGNWLISYNAPGGAYQRLHVEASDVHFGTSFSAADLAKLDAGGLDLGGMGRSYSINGTRVVSSRQSGTAANATDLASAITLVNDLKTKLVAHGLIA